MPDFLWPIIFVGGGLVFAFLVLIIGFGALFGAPFLPTHNPQVLVAFELIKLKKGQTLLELGSGDGRVLLEAARRGIYSIGYELNPFLVLYSKLITWKYRKYIKIVWGNFWHKTLPASDGIFIFLLEPYMKKVDAKIEAEAKKPQKMVSYAFGVADRKPVRVKSGMHLYHYK